MSSPDAAGGLSDNEPPKVSAGYDVSVIDLLQLVADNLRLLIVVPLVAGLAALAFSYTLTPKYTARTTFLPPQQQQSVAAMMLQTLGPLAGVAAGGGGYMSPGERYIAFVESNTVRNALVDQFDLMNRYGARFREDAWKVIGSQTRVSTAKTGLITVQVEDADPKFAADIANAHVEELSRMLGRMSLTEAQSRRSFFEQQLKKVKDGLVTAEISLKSTGINESAIKANPTAAVGAVAALMAQVTAKEVELASMRGAFTESAPDYRRAQAELGALRLQLSRVDRDNGAAGGGSDYVSHYRNFKYHETLYELVAKQYEAARIDESREGAVIQVVDRALPPERRSGPKKTQIAIVTSVITGFVLLMFVFLRHALRNIAGDPESARKISALRDSVRRSILRF